MAKRNLKGRKPAPRQNFRPYRKSNSGSHDRPGRWVIGIHSVREALKVRAEAVEELWVRGDGPSTGDEKLGLKIHQFIEKFKIRPKQVSTKSLDELGSGHQGLACRVTTSPKLDWEGLAAKEQALVLVLSELEDPQNLGAILRTAWLMGVDGILTSKNRAAQLTPAVSKIACGGAEHVPIEIHTSLQRALTILKKSGFWLYGLDAEGVIELGQTEFSPKVALVVGSEQRGLRSSLRGECDQLVRIFQTEKEASYNASVAAALGLAEISRQQRRLRPS